MMKKAKFLTVFLTSAILLSGCKASENSDTVSVLTSTSETSAESSVVSSAVSSVASASSGVSTTISSSSTVISSVESTSTAPTEPTTSEPTTSEPEPVESQPNPEPVVSEPEPAPEWTETPTSGTMYVNMSCFSRAKAVLGAAKVNQYFLNDAVTVTARATSASTGDIYYKIAEGEFIHSDYLSSSKIVIQQPATPSGNESQPSQQPTTPSSSGTPQDGDTKTENGKDYIYITGFGWIEDEHGGAISVDPGCRHDPALDHQYKYAY